MKTKSNEKSIAIFNTMLAIIVIVLGIFIARNNAVTKVRDIDLADLASDNVAAFLSRDIYKEHGTTISCYKGDSNDDATIFRLTAACIDQEHEYKGDGSYTAKAIIDIDNPNGYTNGKDGHSGLNITIAGSGTTYITNSDLVKRARFLARIAKYIQYDGDYSSGYSTAQANIDSFFNVNIRCFANQVPSLKGNFGHSDFVDQSPPNGTGWQRAMAGNIDYKGGLFDTAKNYAENVKAGGIEDKSTDGSATYEYTDTATILGPYKIAKEGNAKVTKIEVKEKGGSTYTASVLDANKKDTTINGMGNQTNFYIKVNKIIGEVEKITVYASTDGVIQARMILCEGSGEQRISIFGSQQGSGSIDITLTPPPLIPIIKQYKYIKSIKQLQSDGSYKELFNITEVPTLTIKNQGTNLAEVTKVTYPDYSKYCEVDENGNPYVNDRDIVEFAWVIYNIGPGDSAPRKKSDII